MKLRGIRLQNVRRFIEPVEVSGIGDGLNVLSAPNENGKSTIFAALHAVFFKSRRSWDAEIRSLAPHAGGDPQVAVEIEVGKDVYRIEKHWSQSSGRRDVKVWSGDKLLKQADEAELWLADTLKAPKDGGPAGLLWVRQGLTSLEDGDATRSARRDLMSSVAGEVEAMTGGRRMDEALNRCKNELQRFLTPTGQPKRDGPLKAQQDLVTELESKRSGLVDTAEKLREQLGRRLQVRRELSDLIDPEAEAARKNRVESSEQTFAEASRHAEQLDRAIDAERISKTAVDGARESLTTFEGSLEEAEAAEKARAQSRSEVDQANEVLALASQERDRAEERHIELRKAAEGARDVLRRVDQAQASAAAAERRIELVGKIEKATSLRTEAEEASAVAKVNVTTRQLRQLEDLKAEVQLRRRELEAEATSLFVEYAEGDRDELTINGSPVPAGEHIPITETAVLDVKAIGRLTVYPGVIGNRGELEKAENALEKALQKLGRDTIEAARESETTRTEAEDRLRQSEAALAAIAPDGLEDLQEKLAALPPTEAQDPDLPSLKDAREAEATARATLLVAENTLAKAQVSIEQAKVTAAKAGAGFEGSSGRLARARARLADIEDTRAELGHRRQSLLDAKAALEGAARRREELAAGAPDLEAAEASLKRARSVAKRADDDRERLQIELGKLDTSIDLLAGDAIEEELADAKIRLEEAQRLLTVVEMEVAVLKRLDSVLEDARASARDSYVEPVKKELRPLLGLLWDDSELVFDADDVLPTALIRDGREEDFSVLSGGTQEQIALLVRLAFARMLARAGTSAPVVLDDAIVYSDDDRIERMFDALTRQAQDLQIIAFSCRQRAFRDLGGQSLVISATAETGNAPS